ncbi:MAG: hypothetical protein AAGB22_05870 [Bacteroidota bacterium]
MLKFNGINGWIDTKVLVTFRVAPEVLAPAIPAPLELLTVNGHALASVCFVRLVRPRIDGWEAVWGPPSLNSAQRIAVQWPRGGAPQPGVFIHRRETASLLNAVIGGRLLPGKHALRNLRLRHDGEQVLLTDGHPDALLAGHRTTDFPTDSVFATAREAAQFAARCEDGYSPGNNPAVLEGLSMRIEVWAPEPLQLDTLAAARLMDPAVVPTGAATLDHALIIRNRYATWTALPPMPLEPVYEPQPILP